MLENIQENELTDKIIGLAIEVHKTYGGPGLKESAYEAALEWELMEHGLKVVRQKPVPIVYKGHVFNPDDEHPKKFDLLVEDRIIVECKAVSKTAKDEAFRAQCRTYLKMLGLRVGLVINFGRPTLKEGVDRVINETREEYLMRIRMEREKILESAALLAGVPAAQNTERGDTEAHNRPLRVLATHGEASKPSEASAER